MYLLEHYILLCSSAIYIQYSTIDNESKKDVHYLQMNSSVATIIMGIIVQNFTLMQIIIA